MLTFPPGVGALLIMFNRYHKYVVEQLAAINENGRFTPRKPASPSPVWGIMMGMGMGVCHQVKGHHKRAWDFGAGEVGLDGRGGSMEEDGLDR